MDIFTTIKDISTTIAALGGLCIAYRGLTTWQRQLRGNTDFDLARRLLRATYDVRDKVEMLRSPWIPPWEYAQHHDENDDKKDFWEKDREATFGVYEARWAQVQSARLELDTLKSEAQVRWGAGAKEGIVAVLQVTQEILEAINRYFSYLRKDSSSDRDMEQLDKWKRMMMRLEDNDETSAKMDAAVKNIEAIVIPHLDVKP